MTNLISCSKVKIQDICTPKPSDSQENPSYFVGLLKTSSNKIYAEIVDKADQRVLSTIFPNENVNIHYLCAILNKLNLSRYLRNTIPSCVPFQNYCDETVDLPSMQDQILIAENFKIIYEAKNKRRSQIKNSYLLMQTLFIKQFGDSVPAAETDPDWRQLGTFISLSRPRKNEERDSEVIEFGTDSPEEICGVIHTPELLPNHFKRTVLLKTDKTIMEPEFLAINIGMPYFKFLYGRNRSISPLKDLPIFCPSLDKQKEFLGKIKPIFTFIDKLKVNIGKWDSLYMSYIHYYLP